MADSGAAPGRPKQLNEPVPLTVNVEKEQLARLEAYCAANKLSRPKAIRLALELLLPSPEKEK